MADRPEWQESAASDVAAHAALTHNVHGIADVSLLAHLADLPNMALYTPLLFAQNNLVGSVLQCDQTGVNDASAAFQALADALFASRAARGVSGDTIVLPPGALRFDNECTYYVENGYAQSVIGFGQYATRIKSHADLGAGKYLLRPSKSRSSLQKSRLAGFAIRGSAGGAAWNMDGVAVASGCVIADVISEGGHNHGVVLLNDHTSVINVRSQGNNDGLYFGYQNNAKDNHYIAGCDLTSNARSSIALAGNNHLGGSSIFSTHLGASPYGIVKEDAGNAGAFATFGAEVTTQADNFIIGSVRFVDVRWEGCSTALVAALAPANGALIDSNLFIGCDQSGFSGAGAAYVSQTFAKNIFIRSESLLAKGSAAGVVSLSSGNAISNYVRIAGPWAPPNGIGPGDLDNANRGGWLFEDGDGAKFRASKADEDIAVGDVVTGWVGGNPGSFKRFDSTFASAVAGVAFSAALSGNYFWRQTSGLCSRVNIIDAAAPDAAHYLIPTTTLGKGTHAPTGVAASARPFARASSGNNGGAGAGWCSAVLIDSP